jgi:hypothetical protein
VTNLALADVAVHHSEYDPDVFAPWLRLLSPDLTPLFPTVLGHLFLQHKDGGIWFLDTWAGQVHDVVEDYDLMRSLVGSNEEFFQTFFMPDLIIRLRESGLVLAPGQCYSPFVSPALGGSLAPDNFMVVTLKVHLATSAAEISSLRGAV